MAPVSRWDWLPLNPPPKRTEGPLTLNTARSRPSALTTTRAPVLPISQTACWVIAPYGTASRPLACVHSAGLGAEHREFCEVFGPEHILPNLGEFLDYFMIRKVIAGKATLRAAGTVTKKLAKWLSEKGYVKAKDAEAAAERSGDAARELPEADELASLLHDFAEDQEGKGTTKAM